MKTVARQQEVKNWFRFIVNKHNKSRNTVNYYKQTINFSSHTNPWQSTTSKFSPKMSENAGILQEFFLYNL